jgi:hypothetical protein
LAKPCFAAIAEVNTGLTSRDSPDPEERYWSMRLRRLFASFVPALGLVALAAPAAADDSPSMPHAAAYAPGPEMRVRWVDECSERLSEDNRHERKRDRLHEQDRARTNCERYYDSYYDYYSGHYRAWQPNAQPAYYQPSRTRAGGCDPSPDCRRDCTETVEYEYVDVPVRAAPRPDKRIRIIPDKRIRLK